MRPQRLGVHGQLPRRYRRLLNQAETEATQGRVRRYQADKRLSGTAPLGIAVMGGFDPAVRQGLLQARGPLITDTRPCQFEHAQPVKTGNDEALIASRPLGRERRRGRPTTPRRRHHLSGVAQTGCGPEAMSLRIPASVTRVAQGPALSADESVVHQPLVTRVRLAEMERRSSHGR